jgi:hypothetical protein
MPPVVTCSCCSAPFIPDEGSGAPAPAQKAARPRCETCTREALEKALSSNREWRFGTTTVALGCLVCAGAYWWRQKRPADLEWACFLAVAVVSALMACFYHFRRVRPQQKQHLANETLDRVRRAGPDLWRLRRLEKLGHSPDWDREQRVLRRRRESAIARSVDLECESPAVLREEKRRNRLLDRIDEVNAQIQSVDREIETGGAFPTDREKLERLRARLAWKLDHPSIWPRLLRHLISKGFFALLLLPFTALACRFMVFAWQAGNVTAVAIMAVFMVVSLWTLPEEFRPDWLTMLFRKSAPKPAREVDNDRATA